MDLRHLNAPQAKALSSRTVGLADVVPTGIVRSNLAKSRAEGESLAELSATPRKPVDITEQPRVDYGEQAPRGEEFGDEPGGAPSGPAAPAGPANPTVSAIGAKGMSTIAGLTTTAVTGNPLFGLIANVLTNTIVSLAAKGQAAAAAHANSSLGPGATPGATLGVTGDDLGSFGVDAEAASPGTPGGSSPSLGVTGDDLGSFGVDAEAASPGAEASPSLGISADVGSPGGEGGFGAEGDMGGGFGDGGGGGGGK